MSTYGMWRTDAHEIGPGAIVKIRRPLDSKGRVTHDHWFVIISPSSEIKHGAVLTAIAISSSFKRDSIDPIRHFPMPYRNDRLGHPETGLRKESWACVDWVIGLDVLEGDEADLEIAAEFDYHFLNDFHLKQLVALRDAWVARARGPRKP